MNNEQLLYKALERIFKYGDPESQQIAEVAMTEYHLRLKGESFLNYRNSDYLRMIAQSRVDETTDYKKLWATWVSEAPYKSYDQKPDLNTQKNVADWFLCDLVIRLNVDSKARYKTRVQRVYELAQKMTTPVNDFYFDRCE